MNSLSASSFRLFSRACGGPGGIEPQRSPASMRVGGVRVKSELFYAITRYSRQTND